MPDLLTSYKNNKCVFTSEERHDVDSTNHHCLDQTVLQICVGGTLSVVNITTWHNQQTRPFPQIMRPVTFYSSKKIRPKCYVLTQTKALKIISKSRLWHCISTCFSNYKEMCIRLLIYFSAQTKYSKVRPWNDRDRDHSMSSSSRATPVLSLKQGDKRSDWLHVNILLTMTSSMSLQWNQIQRKHVRAVIALSRQGFIPTDRSVKVSVHKA